MKNKITLSSESKKCIHGGDYDKCKGQCSKEIGIKTKEFHGILFCILEKEHDGVCHYEF